MKILLLQLALCLSLGLVTAPSDADENGSFQCHRSCRLKLLGCSEKNPRTPYCRTSQQDCMGSCDASPATQSPVSLRTPQQAPLDACRQHCGLTRSSCESDGNDPQLCESGRDACVARCDESAAAASAVR